MCEKFPKFRSVLKDNHNFSSVHYLITTTTFTFTNLIMSERICATKVNKRIISRFCIDQNEPLAFFPKYVTVDFYPIYSNIILAHSLLPVLNCFKFLGVIYIFENVSSVAMCVLLSQIFVKNRDTCYNLHWYQNTDLIWFDI